MVDLLLGFFVAGILLTMLGSVFMGALRVQGRVQDQVQIQRDGNLALDHLSRRISLAGLNLDPAAGEEAYPSLPSGAGGDWGKALAIQYREGSSPVRFSYYLDGGRLVERTADGRSLFLTAAETRVRSLSFRYFTDQNVPLAPSSLTNGSRRALIRRVHVAMELESGSVSEAHPYLLETAVTIANLKH